MDFYDFCGSFSIGMSDKEKIDYYIKLTGEYPEDFADYQAKKNYEKSGI